VSNLSLPDHAGLQNQNLPFITGLRVFSYSLTLRIIGVAGTDAQRMAWLPRLSTAYCLSTTLLERNVQVTSMVLMPYSDIYVLDVVQPLVTDYQILWVAMELVGS
jgi:hypothetical protein